MPIFENKQQRRTSFDAVAQLYDQARPGYPSELYEAILSFANLPRHGRILEIGSGTGKATLPFAARGYRMLCVELGANMAAVARANLAGYPQVEIVVGNFDEMEVEAAAFDLVISAQAFHWLDPAIALPKIAAALHPGATIALFWNFYVAIEGQTSAGPADFMAAAYDVYERHAPTLAANYPKQSHGIEVREISGMQIANFEQFGPLTILQFPWQIDYSSADYIELLGTYSDHLTLDPTTRAAVLGDLRELIDTRFGGHITRKYVGLVYLAHRL